MGLEYYEWIVMPDEAEKAKEYIIVRDIFDGNVNRLLTYDLMAGSEIPRTVSDCFAHYVNEGPKWDSLVHLLGLKIISDSLRQFLDQATLRSEFQALPLQLRKKDEDKRISGYNLLHLLNPVDCINLELTPHSILEDDPNEIELETTTITLHRKVIGKRRLFRVKKHAATVVMREDLKNQIEERGFTGFGFLELNTV